jgi:N-acetylglucosamine-6-phosphate deacetylase
VTGLVLTGARLVSADHDLDGAWVEVRGDRISRVGDRRSGPPDGLPRVDVSGLVLVPGLVDVHQHGGGGGSYGSGPGPAARAVAFHRAQGTTTSVASLVSAPLPDLHRQLADLAPLVEDGLLAGVHLEGPWLNPARRGAHAASALLAPRPEDVGALLAAGSGHVRMVTLAPELPGAAAAVGQLTAAGVVVAVGHTDATYAQTREALRLGARAGTHLFNAMRPLHHREPGPVGALLESDAVVELITDGVHLHPAVVTGAAAALGPERTALVTDAVAAAGMPPGRYRLGDREITVADGVVTGPDGEIAGSTGTLAEALRFAVSVAGVPLRTAVTAATATPARLLGLPDVGSVRPGARADLVLLTPELSVAGVLHRGAWVRELPAAGGAEERGDG